MKYAAWLCLIAITALSVSAFAASSMTGSEGSSAGICSDIRVFIQDPNAPEDAGSEEKYVCSTVSGVQTVEGAVTSALEMQGRSIETNSQSQIISVDGVGTDSDHFWRLFQWLPEGNCGWGLQTFSPASDEKMMSGTSYCINLSTRSNEDGSLVYSVPTFEPESDGYVFIRFANGFNPDNEHVQAVFDPEVRAEGFWLKGHGSSMADVLFDAIESNWPGEIDIRIDIKGEGSSRGWINSLFDLGDVYMYDGVWSYWSQWTWQDHKWGYNNWVLGNYDPAVYHYVECIYLLSTPDPYGDSYAIDKGGPEPDPEKDGIKCLKSSLDVVFQLEDGTEIISQKVKYGKQVDMTQIPEPSLPGMGFQGWGDTTAPVFSDTVFTAMFTPVTEEMKCVTYLAEDGTLVWKDYVLPGGSATYGGIPVKAGTRQYDYEFAGWSSDLNCVTEDLTVTPVFNSILRHYDVHYHNYDRSRISTESTGYGEAAVRPDDPIREPSVMYSFEFVGWSLTPNYYVFVDLDSITDVTYVFAYFEPVAREYTVTFVENGSEIRSCQACYGTVIGCTLPLDLFKGSALAKMYRDSERSAEYKTDYVIIGDTTVYVERIAGSYDSERNESGNVTGNVIRVSFSEDLARNLMFRDGAAVICDISQFPDASAASVDRTSLYTLSAVLGPDAEVIIIVPRGSIAMKISDLLSVCGDSDDISFSIGNGPLNTKTLPALKKINYSTFCKVVLRSGDQNITELPSGMQARLSLQIYLSDGLSADIWNITPNGAISHFDCSYDGRYASFRTDLLQFYAVGTTGDEIVKETVVCPYGETVCIIDGSGIGGYATLLNMKLDNMGGVLFVPSSVQGCTLRAVSGGAFNSVTNTAFMVVPCTVERFSWDSWANTCITDVYFTGARPDFEDTAVPAGVTVHYSPSASGWTAADGLNDLKMYTYNGTYWGSAFYFQYYVVDEKIVVHRYIAGTHVIVPESIAVNKTAYPVVWIGDGAFMCSEEDDVYDLYCLQYKTPVRKYDLEYIEFEASLTEIHTRAFLNSTVKEAQFMDRVEHIWDEAFCGCDNLHNVKFPDTLVFIGESAFRECSGKAFTKIVVPDSVKMIGGRAFASCASLSNVTLGNGLTEIPAHCFDQCPMMTEASISAGIRIIGECAFYGCTGLQYIDLNGVETVGDRAFCSESGSVMEFIVFGENLKNLGTDAFANCSKLTEIEAHCICPESFVNAFGNVDLSKVGIYCSNDVIGSWEGYNAIPLEEAPPDSGGRTLLAVEIGLIVMFAVLGAVSLRIRTRGG